jgi:hypothetical protein
MSKTDDPIAKTSDGLRRGLNAANGISMKDACRLADVHIECMHDDTVALLGETLESIERKLATLDGAPNQQARADLHSLSCAIAGMAAMFGRPSMGDAAYSLCQLIDESEPGWDAPAVTVHVQAMRLLFSPDLFAKRAQLNLVDGLGKVREHAVQPPTTR